jgi:phospholipid/cholesterol/gamma-HCH transport system permease protein
MALIGMERLIALGQWSDFAARALASAVLALRKPGWWLRPFYSIFVGGTPLAAVVGLALGLVVWMHTRGVLVRTAGAAEMLPTFLAVAVLLELAPIGAGLILAARTGASLAAELSSLRATEQTDALEMLGASLMRRLIGPRVLACIVAAPLLHVVITTLALTGGYVGESLSGPTNWLKYQRAILDQLYLVEVIPAAFKTLVFGALVGVTACFAGMFAEHGAEGIGQAATTGVVLCALLVLVADVFLVALIQLVLAWG